MKKSFTISCLLTVTACFAVSCGSNPADPKALQNITISDDAKTKYTVGDEFLAPKIYAHYADDTIQEVTADFSGYNMQQVGNYTVTATYTEKQITKTANYQITVTNEIIPDPLDVKDINPMLVSSEDYLKFFNHTTSTSISITMSKEAAEFMNNYQTNSNSTYHDYYVPCDFTLIMDEQTIHFDDVGIRVKGNTSRQPFLDNGKFSQEKLSHFKFKFCETFDGEEYDTIDEIKQFKKTYVDKDEKKKYKNRRLFDMEKLDIKWNRNFDDTKSKQGFILKTFENNGVLAGKSTLSNVSLAVNSTTPINAVYEVYEVIDDVFISRHFAEEYAAGDLYKCCWQNAPANFSKNYKVGYEIGVEDNVKKYHPAYDLKTNKKKSDHSALLSLIQTVNKDSLSPAEYKEEMSKKMNMNEFLMYESIAFMGGNFDDLRNNANNYYLYFVSGSNYAYIIPYDFDRCFGCGTNGFKNYMTDFSADSTKMQCSGTMQVMSLYWRTVCRKTNGRPARVDSYYDIYCRNIEMLVNQNKVSVDTFANFVNQYPKSFGCDPIGSGCGNISYSLYLSQKLSAIRSNNPEIKIN